MKRLFGGSKPKKVTPSGEVGAPIEDDVSSQYSLDQSQQSSLRPSREILRSQQRPPSAINVDDIYDEPGTMSAIQEERRWHAQSLSPFVSPSPRTTSMPVNKMPFQNPNSPATPRELEREQPPAANVLRKKNAPKSAQHQPPAIGILHSLDHETVESTTPRPNMRRDDTTDAATKDWHGQQHHDGRSGAAKHEDDTRQAAARPKPRTQRTRDHHEEDDKELTRMIGYLTGTASEDWAIVLEVCDRASATDALAKEAMKALRREFKYGEPQAQLSAARLWALMLRNSSDKFIAQIQSRKFLDTLHEVITSPRTSPVVRERLKDVLAAATFAWKDNHRFRSLWKKLKSKDQPEEGIPFDQSDPMLNPPLGPSPDRAKSPSTPRTATPHHPKPREGEHRSSEKTKRRPKKILSPEEDRQLLAKECQIAQSHAALLSQALAYAQPQDLDKDTLPEFYANCIKSQTIVNDQIPWATAGAERSRKERASKQGIRSIRGDKVEQTVEEELLALLLSANEALNEALRLHADLERVGREREAEEISRRDVRMDPREQLYAAGQGNSSNVYQTDSQSQLQVNHISPSRSPSPASLVSQSPPIASAGTTVPQMSSYPVSNVHPPDLVMSPQSHAVLAAPPPQPRGPRSPAVQNLPSRTSSPVQPRHMHSQSHSSLGSMSSRATTPPLNGLERMQSSHPDSSSDDDSDSYEAPVQPSAKALGKRRVIETDDDERPFNPDDIYNDNRQEQNSFNGDRVDSDSDVSHNGRQKLKPTTYAYDAAAERTQMRLVRVNRKPFSLVSPMADTAETDFYEDLYGDDEEEEKTNSEDNEVSVERPPETSTTKMHASLPSKPAGSRANLTESGQSYSAQIAKQFSSHQSPTPQQASSSNTPSAISTYESATVNVPSTAIRAQTSTDSREDGKMFIGGLHWDTTDASLTDYFSQYGTLVSCSVMRDPTTGRSRGFGFLSFEDNASVNAVVAQAEHILDGKVIDPKRAIPREEHIRNTRFFVGGLAPHTNADSMREFFKDYGKVVDSMIMMDRETGRSKGFGFITFEDFGDQSQLVGKPGLFIDDKQVEVKTARISNQREINNRNQANGGFTNNLMQRPMGVAGPMRATPMIPAPTGFTGTPSAPNMMGMNMTPYQRMLMLNPMMMMGMSQMGLANGFNPMFAQQQMMNPMAMGFNPMFAQNMTNNQGANVTGGQMLPNLALRMQASQPTDQTSRQNTTSPPANVVTGGGPARTNRGQHTYHPYSR